MAGRPQSVFDYMCRLLVPLCAARAAEEVLYGRDSMTLSTASEVRQLSAQGRTVSYHQQKHTCHQQRTVMFIVVCTCLSATRPPPCRVCKACSYSDHDVRLRCQMSRAADLAQYLVRASTLHPAFQHSSMLYNMEMGGWEDPTTQVCGSGMQLQHSSAHVGTS